MKRTNLSVDSNVFERFSEVARGQNKKIFAFANESLDFIATVHEEGGSIKDLRRLWSAYLILRTIDVITLPSDFADDLNEKLFSCDKNWTLNSFNQLGRSVGSILKMTSEGLEQLAKLAEDFFVLIPVKHFKFTQIDNVTIQVDIAGAGRKLESAECTAEFVKGILQEYDYETQKVELNVGTVRLRATKKGAYAIP